MKVSPQHMVACFKKTCKFDGKNVTVPENFALSFWKSFAQGLPKTVQYRTAAHSTYYSSKLFAYMKLTPDQRKDIPMVNGIVRGSVLLNKKRMQELKYQITPEELLKLVPKGSDISQGNFVAKLGDWLDRPVILKAQLFLVQTIIRASRFDAAAITQYLNELGLKGSYSSDEISGIELLKVCSKLKKRFKFPQDEMYELYMDLLECASFRAYSGLNPEDLDIRKLNSPHINVRVDVRMAQPCREPKNGRKATYEWQKDNGETELWAMDSEENWYVYAVYTDDVKPNRVRRKDGTIKYLPKRTGLEKAYDEDKSCLFDWNIGGPKPPRKPEPKPKAQPKSDPVDDFDFAEFSF